MNTHLVNLRCEIDVPGGRAFVVLPVEWKLLDNMAITQGILQDRAPSELRNEVERLTGEAQPASRFTDLPVWVEYPNFCVVECVNGPRVGERIRLSTPQPPAQIRFPAEAIKPWTVRLEPSQPCHVYVGMVDEFGFFARTRDGAWKYTWQQ